MRKGEIVVKNIQMKLTVTILIIFLGALSTLGGLNYWKARELVYTSTVNEIKILATNSAGDVSDWLEAHKYEVAGMALVPTLQTGNRNRFCHSWLLR